MSGPSAFPPPSPPVPATTGPAGWYADPWTDGGVRWWDGHSWTFHTAPLAAVTAVRATPATLPLGAAVAAVALTIASLLGARIVLDALGDLSLPIIAYVAISVVVGYGPMVAFFGWATRRYGRGSIRDDLGFRFRWADAGWGPLIWLAAIAAEIAAAAIVTAADLPLTGNTESIDDLGGERGVLIALLISAVLVAPFVEELMFRGVVQRGLSSSMPLSVAIVVQGVLFGAAHVDPARGSGNIGLVILLAAVGMVFGGAAAALGRVGPTIIAHAIFNGVVMVVALYVA